MKVNKEVLFQPFAKQQQFIEATFNKQYKFLLYGGAIRGGKTYVGLAILIMLSRLYPNSRWVVVRKDLQVLKRTTIPSFNKLVPSNFVKTFNQTDYVCKFTNGSEILFMGENYDSDKELNRFRGLECNGFLLEEVNELQEATFNKCIERSGSWIIPNMPEPKVICTCNPSKGWVKSLWYDKFINNTLEQPFFYLPSKITDNPHIPKSYIDSLKSLPIQIYRVFVDGEWEGSDEPDQLVAWNEIYNCLEPNIIEEDSLDLSYYLGVDVAGHGKDKTVAIVMKGNDIEEIITYDETSITEVVQMIKRLINKYNLDADKICVDGAGLGAGVIDILNDDNIHVVNFIGGSSVIPDTSNFRYKNLRAQCYWYLKIAFDEHKIGNMKFSDKLQADLSTIRYSIEGDKQIKIESKQELKKRIGRSPDLADALSYVYWAKIHDKIDVIPGVYVF